jgi:foldase protein PrsA
MSSTHRSAVGALATVVLCVTLGACSNVVAGDIASVNGDKVTRAAFDQRLESSPTAKQVLNQMVQQELVDQYGRDHKINPTPDQVAAKENDIKSKYPPGQFDQILKQQGLTETDVQNILRQQLIVESAVTPQVHVTDADIKAYFDKNHATLDKPEQVRARHILVADLKTADMIEGKLKSGGDFAALAQQYSTDPSSKVKGGELGFFGAGQMVKPFQDAAFSTPVGKITAPVKSPFGYHIIQVEEIKPAQKATLANSRAKIKDLLTQQQQQQAIPAFLQGLRAQATINVYDTRFADVFPPTIPPPPPPAASSAAPPSAPTPAATK